MSARCMDPCIFSFKYEFLVKFIVQVLIYCLIKQRIVLIRILFINQEKIFSVYIFKLFIHNTWKRKTFNVRFEYWVCWGLLLFRTCFLWRLYFLNDFIRFDDCCLIFDESWISRRNICRSESSSESRT